ncbi:MAG: DUF3341 domain-containing protein [Gammaproteobacteria bacterium]
MTKSVMGMFRYQEDSLDAAKKLKSSGFANPQMMSPVPVHDAYEVLEYGVSSVRRFSLMGAIVGAISGFSLAVACALVFILPTGGRAIIAVPPFLIITYEMTILFGVLATLLGFHFVSGLPAWRDAPYRREVIVDRFSVVVDYEEESQRADAERLLREAGAEDVHNMEIE